MTHGALPDDADERREYATSFGAVADEYDAGRPHYPAEAVWWLVGDARLIVEVGAGTGKLTASLAALAPVIATEPLPEMIAVLRRTVPAAMPVIAAAESIPLRDAVADVVVAAQAFHWFDQPAAVRSAARVLRPGGAIAVTWNTRDSSVSWVAALTEVIGGSDHLRPGWEDCFAGSRFGPVEHAVFRHHQVLDPAGLIAMVASRSYLAVAPPEQRDLVLAGVRELVETHPDLVGRTTFELPYVVDCFRAHMPG